ncbi:MAG: DUF4065 domain-containing protein [Sedimentisphaerales bacterium]|nr:DUF4065 domain-containing protein [Sedimentisphaerales bacterium]
MLIHKFFQYLSTLLLKTTEKWYNRRCNNSRRARKMGQTTALETAQYIICFANKAGELITNLKLQKLLYYAQGWYLAHKGECLFDDKFEAWVHGPVIPSIYRRYKKAWLPINKEVQLPSLPEELKKWLDRFLNSYLSIDAFELEKMVHREVPWVEARMGLPMDANCSNEINTNSMKAYFVSLLNGKAP